MDKPTIRGERSCPYGDSTGAVRCVERGSRRFEQTLRVSSDLDPNAIEASMSNGVLTLRLRERESPRPQRIAIRADPCSRVPSRRDGRGRPATLRGVVSIGA